jgi:far upstream element-binding protein
VTLTGPPASIAACRSLLDDLLRTPAGPAPGMIVVPPGGTERVVLCTKQMVGRVIGRAGDVIKGLQAISGARIQIDQSVDPCRVSVTGTPEAVESAAAMVTDISQGGSTVQYGYQAYAARTAAGAGAWPQAQQAAYGGYPGGYPGAYPGYPPQQAYGGAYAGYPGYPGYPGGYPQAAYAGAYAYPQQQQPGAQPGAPGGDAGGATGAAPAAGGPGWTAVGARPPTPTRRMTETKAVCAD